MFLLYPNNKVVDQHVWTLLCTCVFLMFSTNGNVITASSIFLKPAAVVEQTIIVNKTNKLECHNHRSTYEEDTHKQRQTNTQGRIRGGDRGS